MVYVLSAQLLCVLVFVRWNHTLYRRGAALCIAIALPVGFRAYINYASRKGSIGYNVVSSWDGLQVLYDYFRFNPEPIGLLLLAGGLATLALLLLPAARSPRSAYNVASSDAPTFASLDSKMRWPALWREGWLIFAALTMFTLAFVVNIYVKSMTPRNLLILAPSLAFIAAIALRQMPGQLQLLVLVFFCLPFAFDFRLYHRNAAYWDMADYVGQRFERGRDRLIVAYYSPWESIPIDYYLKERANLGLNNKEIFYVGADVPLKIPYVPPAFDEDYAAIGSAVDAPERLRAYIGVSERLWIVKGNPYQAGLDLLDHMTADYSLYSAVSFPGEAYYGVLEVLEYRLQPTDFETQWRFGADINLLSWRLNGDHRVQPCAQVSVDTWWSSERALDELYSSTLVIAGADGQGVANADNVPGGVYLTSIWEPDQLFFDERTLTIPCDLPAGEYPLLLGMYVVPREADKTLTVLPVHTAAGEPTGRQYEYLTTLVVSG